MKNILLLLLLSGSANAANYTFTKQVNLAALDKEMIAAGVTNDGMSCAADKCVIFNPSTDPTAVVAAHVYSDPKTAIDTARSQAIALAKKLKAGTASAAEKDALLLRLCFLLLSNDQ